MIKLQDILIGCDILQIKGNTDICISSICSDSRKVTEGALFIAVKGFASDGHDYIGTAIEKGAAAIICENSAKAGCAEGAGNVGGAGNAAGPAIICVKNSRRALAIAAANFYGNPSSKLTLVGITGTNGKTTTVTLLHRLFTKLGYNCGLLSTIANYVGEKGTEAINTTSDPITINSLLDEMVKAGCEYCFMEVSSIGVEQDRIYGLKFKSGIFSNLTHDHLDYHKTFAEYLRCKKQFFDTLPEDAYAITNLDDKNGMVMMQNTKAKVVTYSCRSMADHTCRVMEQSFEGMLVRMDNQECWSRLIGNHNAYNLLTIYTTAIVLGAKPEEVLIALSNLDAAPGRLENIRGPKDMTVVIDYAHTPDALENVLKTLRNIATDNQLICLFGCGGDRDKSKRPEMGAIAERYADRIIITSDNSRSEPTSEIMAEIKNGMELKGRAKSLMIEDREQAIRTAIMIAEQGATILLAGKGHETYQIIGNEKVHFDEKEIVYNTFKEIAL